jgi:hypothetical protein
MKKNILILIAFLSLQICIGQSNNSDITAEGITSPLHQKYMGKVVFSDNNAITERTIVNEEKFKDVFVLGDQIYFRYYMDNSLTNYLKKLFPKEELWRIREYGLYYFKISLDGAEIIFQDGCSKSAIKEIHKDTRTTSCGAFKSDGESYIGMSFFDKFLEKANSKLTIGSHKIKFEIFPYLEAHAGMPQTPVAMGEFTLKVNENSLKGDPNICFPKARMSNKEIEAEVLAAFRQTNSVSKNEIVVLGNEDWVISRSEATGVITGRYMNAIIAYKKGDKCGYESAGFEADYDGSNYSKKMRRAIDDHNFKEIPCSCLSK